MNIVILYSGSKKNIFLNKMLTFLKSYKNDKVFLLKKKLPTKSFLNKKKINFLISFHNGFILKKNILKTLNYNCINFHSALLPKNRGADPILFSAAKKFLFGVTIHLINEKIDAGEYLYQKRVNLSKYDNLRKAYNKHENESIKGFKKIYPNIKKDISKYNRIKFKKIHKKIKGNFVSIAQATKLKKLLPFGWDTQIKEVRKIYLKNKKYIQL